MAIPVRSLLRRKEAPYAALDLDDPNRTDDEILGGVAANPILIERPIVVAPRGVRLCRPKRDERNPAATEGADVGKRMWRSFSIRRGRWRRCCSRRTPTLSKKRRGAHGIFFGYGVVKAIQPGTGALTLDHGAIKGCMPAMEMMFRVAGPQLSRNLRPGDAIDFTIDGGQYVILKATVVGRAR